MAPNDKYAKYERLVGKAINEAIQPYKPRLKLTKGRNAAGADWEIEPINPMAASIYVYGVDEGTINISVDNTHWLEMFISREEWINNLPIFRRHLDALMKGNAKSWHNTDASKDEERFLAVKTIIEIDTGEKRPYVWVGNIFFFKERFKNKPSTLYKKYEAY